MLMDKYWKYLRGPFPQRIRSEVAAADHGAHGGEGLGSTRDGAKNALQNDDLRGIGGRFDPLICHNLFEGTKRVKSIKSLENVYNLATLAGPAAFEPGGSKGANLKETHQLSDFTLAPTRANQLQDHVMWFNLPTSSRGYQSGASPNSCRRRGRSHMLENKTYITNFRTSSGLALQNVSQ